MTGRHARRSARRPPCLRPGRSARRGARPPRCGPGSRRRWSSTSRARPRDFLAVATPGAGKTTFALSVAAELLGRRVVDRITVVAPDRAPQAAVGRGGGPGRHPDRPDVLRRQGPDLAGLRRHRGDLRRRRGQPAGACGSAPRSFKTLVILDEVHHAGDALSWGEGVREAFEPAARRLALTGTPFRSDINPIPFVTYAPGDDGVPRSVGRLHLRLRARAGRPRRAPGALHGLLRRHDLAHPRRRRGRRPAGRAAHQGPHRAGAAHRARPGGLVDPVGAGGGRQAALARCAGTCPTPAAW